MRYGTEQKERTRQRILDAATALFTRHGIDGVGVDAIMREAGLTHGGFYVHFPSKEALAAEVCADSLGRAAEVWAGFAADLPPEEALERIVTRYLDRSYAGEADRGCVMVKLGADLARRPDARPGVTEAIQSLLETLAACRPDTEGEDLAKERALADLSCMVGAVMLARLSSDPALAEQFLAAARAAVLHQPENV